MKLPEVSKHNLVPFVEIEKALEKMQYGTVSVWFQVHQGKITGIQGNQFRQVRFKEGHNSDAVALILAEIKNIYKKKGTGNFTFTLSFDDGQIKRVYLQKNLRKVYPVRKK